jgi:hypothetical protein
VTDIGVLSVFFANVTDIGVLSFDKGVQKHSRSPLLLPLSHTQAEIFTNDVLWECAGQRRRDHTLQIVVGQLDRDHPLPAAPDAVALHTFSCQLPCSELDGQGSADPE